MVEAARIAYRDYPTVVNEVPESGMSYDNTMAEYARMDNQMQNAQKAIGGSSDSAQLCQSYYWNKVSKGELDEECQQLYENTIILAVLAQVAIDGCKKVYAVNVQDEILRIRSQPCMHREKDFPKFMRWTREVELTKNGRERPYDLVKKEKNKIKKRIDENIVCPMNWLQESLNKIQGTEKSHVINTYNFLSKPSGRANPSQLSKIRKIIEDYDYFTRQCVLMEDEEMSVLLYIELRNMRSIGVNTIHRLISSSLGYNGRQNTNTIYKEATKYVMKMMNILYRYDKEKFLSCFKT